MKETELGDLLSHINAVNERVRFKNIQKKVLAELKKEIDIFLQRKSDFLENNGQSLQIVKPVKF